MEIQIGDHVRVVCDYFQKPFNKGKVGVVIRVENGFEWMEPGGSKFYWITIDNKDCPMARHEIDVLMFHEDETDGQYEEREIYKERLERDCIDEPVSDEEFWD